jgi:hypothetical protein
VVATIRADFRHRAAEVPALVSLAEGYGRLDLAPPSRAELAEMIRKPAQAAGLAFEISERTGLGLDSVLAEHAANEPGALPLLSFTLDELYRRDALQRKISTLTHETYKVLGGLEGAIATRADAVVDGLPRAAQAALARLLRMLTTAADGTEQIAVARSEPVELAIMTPACSSRR